ncbi:hypothetical protein GCM10010207_74670 [Streptomyces atratus]|nr:hypothetical protein GCM10010207_74670 [Streptomyces atratus]
MRPTGRIAGTCRQGAPVAAGVDLGEDIELDEAFQLGAGAFDVVRQQFVVKGFADVTGS